MQGAAFSPLHFHMEKAWKESLCTISGLELMISTSTYWKSFILTKPPTFIADAEMW